MTPFLFLFFLYFLSWPNITHLRTEVLVAARDGEKLAEFSSNSEGESFPKHGAKKQLELLLNWWGVKGPQFALDNYKTSKEPSLAYNTLFMRHEFV